MAPENTTVVENPYGLEALWSQGDFVAKGTLIILVIMSLVSWYLIFTKLWDQRRLIKQYEQMKKMMKTFAGGKGKMPKMPKGMELPPELQG